jgi:hypothetical protein
VKCPRFQALPLPPAGNNRIFLADLAKTETRARLAQIWTDPHALDPTRVTREIAAHWPSRWKPPANRPRPPPAEMPVHRREGG